MAYIFKVRTNTYYYYVCVFEFSKIQYEVGFIFFEVQFMDRLSCFKIKLNSKNKI